MWWLKKNTHTDTQIRQIECLSKYLTPSMKSGARRRRWRRRLIFAATSFPLSHRSRDLRSTKKTKISYQVIPKQVTEIIIIIILKNHAFQKRTCEESAAAAAALLFTFVISKLWVDYIKATHQMKPANACNIKQSIKFRDQIVVQTQIIMKNSFFRGFHLFSLYYYFRNTKARWAIKKKMEPMRFCFSFFFVWEREKRDFFL